MSNIVTVLTGLLGLVRTTVGSLTEIWVFAISLGFACIGLAVGFISGLLGKRKRRRR